jgi:hypothetical protein
MNDASTTAVAIERGEHVLAVVLNRPAGAEYVADVAAALRPDVSVYSRSGAGLRLENGGRLDVVAVDGSFGRGVMVDHLVNCTGRKLPMDVRAALLPAVRSLSQEAVA